MTVGVSAQVDRSKMPEPGPAPKIELGETQSFTLENGLKVFVVENNKLPRVAYSLQLDIDPFAEGDKMGMADLAGDLMSRGTKNRTKDEINFEIDFIGASFGTSATSAFGSSLKKHQVKLLEIMSDVVKNSDFKQEELDKLKTQYISNIQSQKDDPDAISSNVSRVLLYGKDHPYGEIMTEETIENVTLEDAKNVYNTYFKPNVAYLAVVGDITMAEAKELVTKYFGDWKRGEVPTHSYKTPEKPTAPRVAFVNKPGAVQSVISVFNTIDLKPGSPDDITASITNGILGGGFVSKLNLNLREEHSYTYGARSSISADEWVGSFSASAKVRNEVTDSALTEMIKEVMAMRSGDITEDELTTIKNYRSGTFAIGLESASRKASYAINIDKYNLPQDYYATYLKKVADITLADVKSVSKKYINPMQGYILVVGNQEEVAEKLKQFSPTGVIQYYDSYGNEVEETTAKPAPEGVTAQSVLAAYIDAIGGEKNVEKVKSISMDMKATMQGMPLEIEITIDGEGKLFQAIKMNGNVMQKQVYNGEKAIMSGMQGTQNLEGDDLNKMKEEAVLFPEMNYMKGDYTIELKGIDTKFDEEVYVLRITSPYGSEKTNFYSVESGLLLGSEEMIESPQGSFMNSSEFTEYTTVKGVKYPFKISEGMGPQTIEMFMNELTVNPKVAADKYSVE